MYILMVNIHGLVRGEQIEFGRDADTGGQTRYVIDLVRNLSLMPEVKRIDLATRLIRDKRVNDAYGAETEQLTDKASIIRLPCGGFKYLPKEKLWPHLDEYTDALIEYIRTHGRIPDAVHGHYADAGYVAAQIARTFSIPLIFTAHSLGKNKLSFLTANGMSYEDAVRRYDIATRIETEEEVLANADLVIASTRYEQVELYGQYEHRDIPRYAVIPPGLELDKFFPYYNYELPGSEIREEVKQAHNRTLNELRRFHFEPEKPLILTLCRPDARKNIDRLIEVYGRDKELQAIANLVIYAGIRNDITKMGEGEQQVLTDILLLMDKYDLYGKMAIPKHHDPERDVPEFYRIAALKRGVFVSASYLETFGLTFIEASSCGLPFVATNKGGPVDIVENCGSGLLADIAEPQSIAEKIKMILTDQTVWNDLSEKGVNATRRVYAWENHCRSYLERLSQLRKEDSYQLVDKEVQSIGKRFDQIEKLLITDIDDTLLGDDEALPELLEYIGRSRGRLGFGVATGRDCDSAMAVLEEHGVRDVDIVIASVGTEIYYNELKLYDKGWKSRIRRNWKVQKIREALQNLPFLSLQKNPAAQRDFKVSYDLDSSLDPEEALPLVHNELAKAKLAYNLVFSHGAYLDILPYRASKGHAIRYISRKWKIPMHRIYTAGNSGNDRDMLYGRMRGIVVSNYEDELEQLRRHASIYFCKRNHAAGVLEGLKYWDAQAGS